ncbi:hypothetical protein C8J57DRAFT_1365369 [Mycena rebaudengoi]|nr:hypothetical protein C8J57DRAFT_1365369 [Mycena rebaudengoi]
MASGLAPASSSFSAPSHLTCDPTPLATRGGWDRVVWSSGSRSCYGLFHLSSLRTLRLPSFLLFVLSPPLSVYIHLPSPRTRGGWDRVAWSNGFRSCYCLFHLSSLRTLRLSSFRTLASPVCVHPPPFSTYQGRVGPGRLVKWLPVLLLPPPPFFFVYSLPP